MKADFFNDCTIPDLADLNVKEKNLLILDDTFLGKQIKQKCIIREDHTIIVAFLNYFRLPRQTIRDNANLIILFSQDTKIKIIYTPAIVMMICMLKNSRNFVETYGVQLNITS